jgi:hypothetical protein
MQVLFRSMFRARICKCFRSPGIDSKESIPPAYVAWRAGTTNRARTCKRLWSDSEESISPTNVAWRDGTKKWVVVPARQAGNRFLVSLKGLQIPAQMSWLPFFHSTIPQSIFCHSSNQQYLFHLIFILTSSPRYNYFVMFPPLWEWKTNRLHSSPTVRLPAKYIYLQHANPVLDSSGQILVRHKETLVGGGGSKILVLMVGTSVPDPWHFGVDPDPRLHASD